MKITIAHLYPNELALYGENGNVKALKYELEHQNYKVEVININDNDKINFKDYDLIYIGSGRPRSLEIVKKRLEPHKEEFLKYIEQDKILLVTGNALSILDFLDFYEVKYFDERKVSDVTATTSLCQGTINGFQNTEYLIKSTTHLLFNIEKGYGNDNIPLEGFNYKNFYVTSIIGPILARNEKLTAYFINLLKN